MSRPLLFYSFFPLGYHNQEAERKALAFARAGYDVVHVLAPLIRNPGLGDARKIVEIVRSRFRPPPADAGGGPLRPVTLLVAAPRQLDAVRRANALWVERQLRRVVPDWTDGVAWIRWPTPELVAALPQLRPAAVVYECVDAYWETPGIAGRWARVYERAERELVAQSDLVVATSPPIAERFRELGAAVRLLPHGVDVFPWREPAPRRGSPTTLGFVGTLDYRLEVSTLRRLAEAHPDWRLRLVGAVQRGFDPAALAGLANVTVEPPVPHAELPKTLAEFDVGVMPYFDHPVYTHMCPVKTLELLAAGKPAVARPTPALDRFADLLYFARTPDEFVRQVERAVAEDTPERARARRAAAEANTWDRRLAEMCGFVDDVLARREPAAA